MACGKNKVTTTEGESGSAAEKNMLWLGKKLLKAIP